MLLFAAEFYKAALYNNLKKSILIIRKINSNLKISFN